MADSIPKDDCNICCLPTCAFLQCDFDTSPLRVLVYDVPSPSFWAGLDYHGGNVKGFIYLLLSDF